ncbi:MAG TPA: sigma-70 family RNA polymerase sigma factor [Actinomycetota bacterium]|nr:sigma-70 family RNA polymerase sigma factor [Actinomycetota bacterium]
MRLIVVRTYGVVFQKKQDRAGELVAQFEGFSDFYAANWANVFGALVLQVRDRAIAEELTQEAFTRASARWKTVTRADSPEAWVYRVAFNLANSHFRRRAAERRARRRLGPGAPEARTDPDSSAVVTVRAALARLPRRERTAIVLRYYADLPVRVAAEVMACPEGTLKTLVHRGQKRLERDLAPLSVEEER